MKNYFTKKSNKEKIAESQTQASFKHTTKPETFGAYSQRSYNFKNLENILLGNNGTCEKKSVKCSLL